MKESKNVRPAPGAPSPPNAMSKVKASTSLLGSWGISPVYPLAFSQAGGKLMQGDELPGDIHDSCLLNTLKEKVKKFCIRLYEPSLSDELVTFLK